MIADVVVQELQELLAGLKDVKVVSELSDSLTHPLPESGALVAVVEHDTAEVETAAQAQYLGQRVEVHILAVKTRDEPPADKASRLRDLIVNRLNAYVNMDKGILDMELTRIAYPAAPAQTTAYVVLEFKTLIRVM